MRLITSRIGCFFDWKVFGREEEEVKCVLRREEWVGGAGE